MKIRSLLLSLGLPVGLVTLNGCALFVVGAAVGAGAGGVSYMSNELRTTQNVTVDAAWKAANAAMQELQFAVIEGKSFKDATGGTLYGHNAKDQPIRIQLLRQSDNVTEIRVRVGTFDTTANRETARLIYDKMKARL
ncbi:MAG TPA: DUF3568 family protein [Verrucomicrobiae bacterium]|nr:DUF3568 family protein [Verrucomicrobiae bacterium]